MKGIGIIILEMENIRQLIQDLIAQGDIILSAVISNARNKDKISKVRLRPLKTQGDMLYQAESFVGTKAYHSNLMPQEVAEYVTKHLEQNFKQLKMETTLARIHVLVSKKGTVTIKEKAKPEREAVNPEQWQHNKQKKYLLPQEVAVPFLVDLGVQTAEGAIVSSKYDKFRQINRYLEFVRDILPELPHDRTVTIIDFGCGKSYLTFALYYYLKVMNQYDIRVIGLDLKEDVIAKCNSLSQRYGYDGLQFYVGDISTFEGVNEVDMVVTLHACDTATDYALEKAVKWNARVIFSVPCCQHEVNKQISCKELDSVLKYGLIKERMSALITDAVRANLLEQQGYDTQIMEFIDMEHTPKNILIRAVKRNKIKYQTGRTKNEGVGEDTAVKKLEQFLHINPTLQRMFDEI